MVDEARKIINDRDNDIYIYELDENAIKAYSDLFIKDGSAEKYLDFNLFQNKFAMKNIARISRHMGYPNNENILGILLRGLQDANWPFFEEFIDTLVVAYPRNILINTIDETLLIADEDEDYMWVSGLFILSERLKVNKSELKNISIFDKRDF